MITKKQFYSSFDDLLEKLKKEKKLNGIDLSTEEDMILAIMNLISLEEHFFFTGVKTEKDEYYDLLNETRTIRKELMAKIMDKNEGETWCISKHLLAVSIRLIEVGTKLYSDKKNSEAKEMFARAYKTYSMFWGVRLKLIDALEFKKIATEENNFDIRDKKPWTFKDIVDKLVDCCDEK